MVVQAITNLRVQVHRSRTGVPQWGVIADKYNIAVTSELKGENMYHFFGKLVDVVMPKIRDWKGISGSSGDDSGNITFGLEPSVVALFPEIEVNYDMYVLISLFVCWLC
jgi:large subunit ribosomal protein L5